MIPRYIISVEITKKPRPMPEGMFDPMPKVIATFDDGSVEELFEYYPDEISFTASEFKNLTKEQALRIKLIKDKAYLQS